MCYTTYMNKEKTVKPILTKSNSIFDFNEETIEAFAPIKPVESHQKTIAARQSGIFAGEILPVIIQDKKGDITVSDDETPRADTTIEKLSKLGAAFRKGGTVTAGNSSSLNDGASAMLVVSERAVKEYNLTPIARFVASGAAGLDPRIMGVGPVYATGIALKRAGLSLQDIGLVELNEAFAAQSLACIRELGLDPSIVNISGGAIAIGHPLGMSGARITGTLVRGMKRTNTRYGLATLCIGVGQGLAAVYERV